MSKDKAERKLKKVTIGLMRNPVFALWSGILMVGKTSLVEDAEFMRMNPMAPAPTAATDGRDKIFARGFVDMLSTEQLAFVVLHEGMHIALRHLTTWRKLYNENPGLANISCDYVVNLMIKDTDPEGRYVQFPTINGEKVGLIDEKYRGMHAKQVFDLLKQNQKQQSQSGDGDGDGDGEGQPGNKPGKGGSKGKSPGKQFDHHDWGKAKGMTDAEKQTLEREVDQALRQGAIAHAKQHGTGNGNMHRELGDLMEPQIDWREALREFVTSMCNAKDTSSWRRVNRRFIGQDIYLPTLIGEKVGRVVIATDTSGSCIHQAPLFMSEAKAIMEIVRPEKVDLIYWDSSIEGHEEYDDGNYSSMEAATECRGGGGTSPSCVSKYLNKNKIEPVCIIMLTDGYVPDWGEKWPAPVLWVITETSHSSNKIMADNGKTVHIRE